MIPRAITTKMTDLLDKFPILSLTGARQSGKTTLLKETFPDYRYINLEQTSVADLARTDIQTFLSLYGDKVIFDEAQRVPDLFSELQVLVDERRQEPGQFILSGSQNFLLMDNITQSLAGRVAIMHLPSLSYAELRAAGLEPPNADTWSWRGGYPRLYDIGIPPEDYFPNYVSTYVERDVRHELGVQKLAEFRTFLTQCALHAGELVNYAALAQGSGVDAKTAAGWLSLLESSFIVFRLYPYHRNMGKRLVKTPKLYFYDTGLAAYLLGIDSPEDLPFSKHRGALFENAVIGEVIKHYHARGRKPQLCFWRDSNRKEIDLLVEKGGTLRYAVEIKASTTYDSHAFGPINDLAPQLGLDAAHCAVVYGGGESFDTRFGRMLTIDQLDQLVV